MGKPLPGIDPGVWWGYEVSLREWVGGSSDKEDLIQAWTSLTAQIPWLSTTTLWCRGWGTLVCWCPRKQCWFSRCCLCSPVLVTDFAWWQHSTPLRYFRVVWVWEEILRRQWTEKGWTNWARDTSDGQPELKLSICLHVFSSERNLPFRLTRSAQNGWSSRLPPGGRKWTSECLLGPQNYRPPIQGREGEFTLDA